MLKENLLMPNKYHFILAKSKYAKVVQQRNDKKVNAFYFKLNLSTNFEFFSSF